MAFNKNELILDRVRSLTACSLIDKKMLFRLTSIEDPSVSCTAEGEEVTDAVGSLITTLYRAKKATISGTNSLISLDLASAQYGSEKEVADTTNKITDYTYEILEVASGKTKVKLAHKPVNANDIKWIYSIVDNEIGTAYSAAPVTGGSGSATATTFVISDEGEITVPTGFTGKLFVEYTYETENAVRVSNKASKFPDACSVILYCYFRDKCSEKLISGKIVCPKAKLDPSQIELALTSTGKHPFTFNIQKDYCADEGLDELFSIIVSE